MKKNEDMLKFQNRINTIILGDSIEIMKQLPDESIDLIFADPPYNLQLEKELYRPNETRVNGVNEEWDRFKSFEDYDNFTKDWLQECKRILKKNGAIWVIGTYHNIFRIGKIMQDLGYWILNDVVWIKTNPMPNFKGTRFNNAQETLIWASKDKESKYTFNYKTMKTYNDDLQMRSDWYIPICQGAERIKVEGQKAHPTQKPEALLYRIITATSKPDDIILDPFAGTGTTLVVAKKLGRKFVGIEREPSYIELVRIRLESTNSYERNLLDNPLEIKNKRLPFGSLIERGYVRAGEYLYSENGEHRALILANGTLSYENIKGSIHRVSAYILNKQANNGWTFWYVKRDNRYVSINDLRKKSLNEI
ncbi:site-specific DNA-methyltransferase [Cuniculiplasma sp. SKW4]|uniref:site-specific DNA-methyltransferase n=1 Tax=Cuniculiplasma sp. SKW4 TaxID=3400171 RepID=UPI003FD2C890